MYATARALLATIAALAFNAAASPVAAQAAPAMISFTDGGWLFQGDSVRPETFDGRATLSLRNGIAFRRDVSIQDGTIDVDVMTVRKRSFVYVMFRMQSDSTYEDFYLRPHKSGAPDAIQYAPVYQKSSAWQLYHGADGTASVEIEPAVWNHLRIVLQGRQAAIFLGDTTKPVMIVPRLGHEPRTGFIALRALLPRGVVINGPVARFSNLRVRPALVPFSFPPAAPPATEPGIVRSWMVGAPFQAPDSAVTTVPAGGTTGMRRVDALSSGLVELHRVVPLTNGIVDGGVVARLTVVADSAGIYRMDLGFSDEVTAFVNGSPLFHGNDSYDYANRRDGLIGFDQAALFLPLKTGKNVLDFVVTDFFGGWGIMGRFPSLRGLHIVES